MQELNREANTLGSKSVVAEVSQTAMELKLLIEQMREQIQNLNNEYANVRCRPCLSPRVLLDASVVGLWVSAHDEPHGEGAQHCSEQSSKRNVVTFNDVLHVWLQYGAKHSARRSRRRCEKSRTTLYFVSG